MYFDAHTHVHFAAYDKDRVDVLRRAKDAGVWMMNVGTQLDTSRKAIDLAHKCEEGLPAEALAKAGVFATVGLHPVHTEKSYHDEKELGPASAEATAGKDGWTPKEFTSRGEEFDYSTYKILAQDRKVVAIGECGLDYYRLGEDTKIKQRETFIKHIELAHEVRKPLMIHCRNAFDDMIETLASHTRLLNDPPGVIHFFTGTPEDAMKLLNLGFAFTFGGVVTFARDYDEAIKLIPRDRILSETDAPYVAPVPYRGKRNEPAYVVEVVKKLAELKNISPEEMKEHIFENARKIFIL